MTAIKHYFLLLVQNQNFWAHSSHPKQNTDKWWKWSTECCGVLLEMTIISFTLTQRALRIIEPGGGIRERRRQQTAMDAQRLSKSSLIYLFKQSAQTQQREFENDLHRHALPPSESLYAKPQKWEQGNTSGLHLKYYLLYKTVLFKNKVTQVLHRRTNQKTEQLNKWSIV